MRENKILSASWSTRSEEIWGAAMGRKISNRGNFHAGLILGGIDFWCNYASEFQPIIVSLLPSPLRHIRYLAEVTFMPNISVWSSCVCIIFRQRWLPQVIEILPLDSIRSAPLTSGGRKLASIRSIRHRSLTVTMMESEMLMASQRNWIISRTLEQIRYGSRQVSILELWKVLRLERFRLTSQFTNHRKSIW